MNTQMKMPLLLGIGVFTRLNEQKVLDGTKDQDTGNTMTTASYELSYTAYTEIMKRLSQKLSLMHRKCVSHQSSIRCQVGNS